MFTTSLVRQNSLGRSRRPGFFGSINSNSTSSRGSRQDSACSNWHPTNSIPVAQRFFLHKLRQGIHPGYIDWEVRQELNDTPYGVYNWHFLLSLVDISSRLRDAGSFAGLPSLAELDAVERIIDKRIILEQMIKDRFFEETYQSLMNPRSRRPAYSYGDDGQSWDRTYDYQRQLQQQQNEEIMNLQNRLSDMSDRLSARLAADDYDQASPNANHQRHYHGERSGSRRDAPPLYDDGVYDRVPGTGRFDAPRDGYCNTRDERPQGGSGRYDMSGGNSAACSRRQQGSGYYDGPAGRGDGGSARDANSRPPPYSGMYEDSPRGDNAAREARATCTGRFDGTQDHGHFHRRDCPRGSGMGMGMGRQDGW